MSARHQLFFKEVPKDRGSFVLSTKPHGSTLSPRLQSRPMLYQDAASRLGSVGLPSLVVSLWLSHLIGRSQQAPTLITTDQALAFGLLPK